MTTRDKFEEALQIVGKELYRQHFMSEPLACQMHQAFGQLGGGGHNCLGCNFADATIGISHALQKIVAHPGTLEQDFAEYILWLYLFVERADVVFDIVDLQDSVRHRQFDVFITIKRWANFLKHPNYFILVHHPHYQCESPGFDRNGFSAVIDTEFVREYFGAETKSRSSAVKQKLQNKANVAVLFPDPVKLTIDFCEAAKAFVAMPEKNEIIRGILSDVSTYDTFFSDGNKVPFIGPA